MVDSGCKSTCEVLEIEADRLYAVKTKFNHPYLAQRAENGLSAIAYFLKVDNQLVIFDSSLHSSFIDLGILKQHGLNVSNFEQADIFLTHGHTDHSNGVRDLAWLYNATVHKSALGIGEDGIFPAKDAINELVYGGWFLDEEENPRFPIEICPFSVDDIVQEGNVYEIGDTKIQAHYGQGHSRDGIVYSFDTETGLYLVCGDSIEKQDSIFTKKYQGDDPEASVRTVRGMLDVAREHGNVRGILAGHNYWIFTEQRDVIDSLERCLVSAHKLCDERAEHGDPIIPPTGFF